MIEPALKYGILIYLRAFNRRNYYGQLDAALLFDLHDHSSEFDRLGTELDSQRAAQVAAVEFAGEILKNEPSILDSKGLAVDARDEEGAILFTVHIKLIDHR